MSVYTPIDKAQLEDFLQNYALGELTNFEGIEAGIENTNYFVDTSQGRFVLTIFEQHQAEELDYFLKMMSFMAQNSIPTAEPQADKAGKFLQTLANKPAVLVERLQGKTLEKPSLKQAEVMAQNLAKFHKVGFEFGLYRPNDRDLNWAKQLVAHLEDKMNPKEQLLAGNELAFQEAIDWAEVPQSVIHADLFTDNAMFEGEEITGIIDLYYACHGACIYDFAVMVNDWCRTADHQLDKEFVEACWKSYQAERQFTPQELKLWPAALRMAALRFWLSRLKDKIYPKEGELTFIKDPEVFQTLLIWHRENAESLKF